MRKLLRIYIGLVAFVSFFSSIHTAEALTDRHFTLVPNVEYYERTLDRGVKLRALVFDPKDVRFGVEGKGGATVCNALFTAGDINTMANDASFIAAINAQFFRSGQGQDNSVIGDYIGNAVHYGKNWPSMQQNSPSVATEESGTIIQGTGVGLNESMVRQNTMFINGIFKINKNGSLANISDQSIQSSFNSAYGNGSSNATGAISRTFLGVNIAENEDTGIDQNKIILMTGGSGNQRDTGVTPKEGVDFLKQLGATDAYILDSGGSTMMKINPRYAASGSEPATNAPHDGRGLATLLVIRTGSRQTQAEVANLPVKQCRGDQPQPPAQPAAPAPQDSAPAQPAAPVNQVPVTQTVQQVIPSQTVQLEVPIGDVNLISGAQNYILSYTKILFTYIAGLAGILALLMLIVSGFQIMIGGTEQIGKAKERIAGSLAGLVLLTCGGFILYLINPCFYNFSNSSACTPRGPASTAVVVSNPEPANIGTGNGPVEQPAPSLPQSGTPPQPQNHILAENEIRSPAIYAREKMTQTGTNSPGAPQRWVQYGSLITRLTSQINPGAAPEIIIGAAVNGGYRENTTGYITGSPEERALPRRPLSGNSTSIHELGTLGVEGGPASGLAPAANSNWSRIATSPELVSALGRAASTEPGEWINDIEAQYAIGMINNRQHGRDLMRDLPANIQASSEGSLWFVACSYMAWSSGNGGAASLIRPFASQLAQVPENRRWGTLIKLVAEAGKNGTLRPVANGSEFRGHQNPFWRAVRAMQKVEVGKALAQSHGGNVAYFDDGLTAQERAEAHRVITSLSHWGDLTWNGRTE